MDEALKVFIIFASNKKLIVMVNIMVRWCIVSFFAFINAFNGVKPITTNTSIINKHPFYVSVIEINHNAKAKTAEISIRIFTEDLEKALSKYGNTKVDMLKPTDKAVTNKLLNNYIQHVLHLNLNGIAVRMNYLGYEQQQESIWTYLEVENVVALKKAAINCSLMYDYQDKQINIFHLKANGNEKSYKLDYPQTDFSIEFYN